MTNQTRLVSYNNSSIAGEWGKYGKLKDNTEYIRSKRPHFGKKKSDETKAREASERRYTRRSNICSECFQTRATGSGSCGCPE